MTDASKKPSSGSSEVTAIVHLYRAEAYRSTVWRQRLDMTTNWAVVTTGIALSLTFSSRESSELPLVLVSLLVAMFLNLEARRYRYFDVFRYRARLLEIGFYVPILRGDPAYIVQGASTPLSDDYIRPQFRISYLRAVGKRLRRNYSYIFAILFLSYLGKIEIHPTPLSSWEEFIERASLGPVNGYLSLAGGIAFNLFWILIALITWFQERADKTAMRHAFDWGEDARAPGPPI